MLFIERVVMALVILGVKVLRRKKYTQYKLDAMKQDLERNRSYPMVLIQIPMYNEKEVNFLPKNKAMQQFKIFLRSSMTSKHINHSSIHKSFIHLVMK